MRYKNLLFVAAFMLSANYSLGQVFGEPAGPKKIDINLLLRSSLEIPDGGRQAGVKLNEARFEVTGTILPDLDYRVRYRLNRSQAPTSQDNAAGAIDIAAVNYKFGKDKKWSVNVGKQAAFVGSWEFENNPTYEYQYSEFINFQTNIFLMAVRFGYQIDKNHSVYLQLHNTYNDDFNSIHSRNGYATNGLAASETPLGIYASWVGNMFDEKLRTFWSYNLSKYADGDLNHSVALGQKVQLEKFHAYFDVQSATLGMDYPNISSPAVNNYMTLVNPGFSRGFARDVNYKSAVLRLDYQFLPKWFVTTKGYIESASHRGDNSMIGKNFRQNIGYLVGLEFKPISSENFKIFSYYYNNTVRFNNTVAQANDRQQLNLFSIGFLYFVNAL